MILTYMVATQNSIRFQGSLKVVTKRILCNYLGAEFCTWQQFTCSHLYGSFVCLCLDREWFPDSVVFHVHKGASFSIHTPGSAALCSMFCL